MNEPLDRWKRFERSADAYATVTGLLLLLILVPIATANLPTTERIVTVVLIGLAVVLSMAASAAPRWTIHTAWGASLLVLISQLLDTSDEARGVGALVLALLLIASPAMILRRIGSHDQVSPTTIWGAIAAYLAFGIAFSVIYATINSLNPDAFRNMTSGGIGDTNYFSFVTMTTLGYGDITPVGEIPKALAVLQALLGQIYLVVVVARVVSLLGPAQSIRGNRSR